MDNRQKKFWLKRKGFKGQKRRKSLMEKARRDNYLVWCGGPPGRKRLRRRLSSPRPKTSSFLSEKKWALEVWRPVQLEDLVPRIRDPQTYTYSESLWLLIIHFKSIHFVVQRFAKTCNAHEPGSRVKIISLNYVETSGFWIHVTECLKNPQFVKSGH